MLLFWPSVTAVSNVLMSSPKHSNGLETRFLTAKLVLMRGTALTAQVSPVVRGDSASLD